MKREPGAHRQPDDGMAEKTYPIISGPGHASRTAWCDRRTFGGDEDRVWIKYRLGKEGAARPVLAPISPVSVLERLA
jgi:hypothetical protein